MISSVCIDSIDKGKLADLVLLSANPLEIAPEELWGLEVLETIKEREMIYRSPQGWSAHESFVER